MPEESQRRQARRAQARPLKVITHGSIDDFDPTRERLFRVMVETGWADKIIARARELKNEQS